LKKKRRPFDGVMEAAATAQVQGGPGWRAGSCLFFLVCSFALRAGVKPF
jgi:hypothetical protein